MAIPYVTKFFTITLMDVPETIRIFDFTTVLLTSQKHILHFSAIQSIFTALEP